MEKLIGPINNGALSVILLLLLNFFIVRFCGRSKLNHIVGNIDLHLHDMLFVLSKTILPFSVDAVVCLHE